MASLRFARKPDMVSRVVVTRYLRAVLTSQAAKKPLPEHLGYWPEWLQQHSSWLPTNITLIVGSVEQAVHLTIVGKDGQQHDGTKQTLQD